MTIPDIPPAEASLHIDAPPERVWQLISNIHLVASLSGECQGVEWADGAAGVLPAVGRSFRGRNRHPAVGEWTSVSHIVACEEPRRFGWDVGDRAEPAASWRFELTPCEGGTDLRQQARLGPGRSNLTRAMEARPDRAEHILAHRLAEVQAGLEANLIALKKLAEQPPSS